MSNPLLLHNNNNNRHTFFFSPVTSFAFPAKHHPFLCFSSIRVTPSLYGSIFLLTTDRAGHRFTHRTRLDKISPLFINEEEGRRGRHGLCVLARSAQNMCSGHGRTASHGRPAKHGRRTASYGKPASYGQRMMKKKMKEEEAEKGQAPAKLSSSKPSRDCIALLFERQPHRLHNNVAMFEHTAGELSNSNQPSPQEPSASTQKVPRLDWERSLSFANGDSQFSSSNGNVKPRPDFSTKLLDILTSFKKKDGLANYANLTGDMELQPADKSMREDAMQMSPPSKVFISPGFQSRLVQAMETQPKVVDETLNVGSQDDMQGKDVLHKDTQHDLPREDIQHDWLSEDSQHVLSREDNQHDRPSEDTQSDLPRKDSQHDRPSDDIQHDLLRAYVQHDRPCEDTQHDMPSEYTLAIEESDFSSESSDEDGYGDEIEHSQSKFEVLNERERYVSLEGKARLISASTPHVLTGKGRGYVAPRHLSRSTGSRSSPSRSSIPGRRSKYSKPDPKAKQGSTSVSKSSKTESPSQPLPKFKMNIELHGTSELKGEDDEDSVTVMSFQKSQAQAAFQLEESIFFDWSDSDAEDGLPASTAGHPVPVSMEEWSSCSDDEDVSFPLSWMSQGPDALAAEESISFDEYNSDAKADVKNGLSSATALHPPVFSSMEEWSTCSDEDIVTSSLIPFSDQGPNADARSYCNGEESQQPVLDTKCNHISSVGADQNVPHDRVHQNTASVKLVESPLWKNHPLSDLPFEIQYSYSETPNAPILGYREHYSPFGPATMRRPWTGGPPLRPRRHQQAIESFNSALERKKGFNYALYPKGQAGKRTKTREEILGTPLNQEEIVDLVQTCQQENRQVNLGRDGLTHNMLNLIHTHWKRQPLCKIKCMGVPTVDMDNVCFHVEHKTGGQIIYQTGGVLYVFRGRNYSYEHRPRIPLMLWKPASPVYPKLVPQAPAGLTNEEAYQLRILGQKVEPLCKLRKNGVFLNLVKDVRDAFRVDDLVSLDYEGLKSSDYKKIGAKLRDLVPCVLLSFRNQRIVLWKGRDLESSSVVDTKEPAGVVRLTANSMQCTNVRASETDLKVLRNEMLLSDLGIVYPHATDDNISPASNKESKQVHHSGGDLDSLHEYSNMIDSSDLISHAVSEQPVESECLAQKWELAVGEEAGEDSEEARITLGEPFKIASLEEQCLDQYSDEIVALSDVPVLSEYFPLCWDEHREFCVRSAGEEGGQNSHLSDTKVGYTPFPVYGVAGEGLDEQEYPSIPPPSTEWAQWNGRHRPKSLFGNVDALWEVALKYGMAVELDDADLEADLVLQKATVFSEIAPAQPEYTEKLVNRLRLKKEYEKAEKCLEVQFGCGGENQTKQNKSAKRAPRFPALEMPPRSGLQVDDLAKILAPK